VKRLRHPGTGINATFAVGADQPGRRRGRAGSSGPAGSIEQDAGVVMFVFREEYCGEREKPGDHDLEAMAKWTQIMEQVHGKAEVIIGKQRHGPIGSVELSFEGRFTRFGNLVKPWQQEGDGF